MTKIAVLLADGFEEIEALTAVDVLRRMNYQVDVLGVDHIQIVGSHQIRVQADTSLQDKLTEIYDAVVVPGGMPGARTLRDNEFVRVFLQQHHNQRKCIAAICAAPIVLEKAGILSGKQFTCYPGFEQEISSGIHVDQEVVCDGNILTAKGAGVALEFAYELIERLGDSSDTLRAGMIYTVKK